MTSSTFIYGLGVVTLGALIVTVFVSCCLGFFHGDSEAIGVFFICLGVVLLVAALHGFGLFDGLTITWGTPAVEEFTGPPFLER